MVHYVLKWDNRAEQGSLYYPVNIMRYMELRKLRLLARALQIVREIPRNHGL
jgi:hypothetical protein